MRTPVLDRIVPPATNQGSPGSGSAAATLRSRLQERWSKESAKTLTFAAVHEDFLTGVRVSELCRSLAANLNSPLPIIKQMWLINLLRSPQLRAVAAHEAATADLIIVAFHDSESFPIELQHWAELWLQDKNDRPIALLGLLSEPGGGARGRLEVYLEDVARRGGMGFFLWPSEMSLES